MAGMTARYDEVIGPLREAYDAGAAWRDSIGKEPWKQAERQAFRERLAPGARLLEVGAGTGRAALRRRVRRGREPRGPDRGRRAPAAALLLLAHRRAAARLRRLRGFGVADFRAVATDRGQHPV
jgi:hypothetical protein